MRSGLLVVFILFHFCVCAQTKKQIQIDVQNTALSSVFLNLKEKYGFQFAFDNDLLSKYKITVKKSFLTEDETIAYLLKQFPLTYEKSDNVFLVYARQTVKKATKTETDTQISGQVLEAKTFEPLPFSYIIINQKLIQSDNQGNFNFLASADTSFNLRISHLGYFVYDTLINNSLNKRFFLNPQINKIKEVKVRSNPIEKSTLIGDKPGSMKINHQIAPILSGHGDNSIFNLLRLMPGILAAGEQSTDLLIWGSYESHSKIQFDGFTVFGLKNFNDNISVVNPFVVKNIEVYKGGYEARYGGRVGGIVDIAGKNGNMQKPSFTFNINTTTLNSLLELPITKKSTLMAAYRRTYYQLYNPTTLNLFRNTNAGDLTNSLANGIDFTVVPNYNFNDANLKYTIKGDKQNQFFISLYGGGDKFLYNMDSDFFNYHISRKEAEKNNQFGGAANYIYKWKQGAISNFTVSYAEFERLAYETNDFENTRNGKYRNTKNIESENNVDEITIKAEHNLFLYKGHKLILGGGAINNKVKLYRESFDSTIINLNSEAPRFFTFIQDELPVSNFLDLKSGVRMVYAAYLKKWYAEPRISTSVRINDNLKINASWGLYNQFMAKTILVDSSLNYSYFWANSDDEIIPVLHAQHFVGGISYNSNGLTLSAEAYHKTTDGINRFFNGTKRVSRGFYHGDGKSSGLDIFIKKEYKRHMAWISYTLSKTEEHFPFYFNDEYKLAPHHQKHELKLAGILNFNSFYFSANYVYGSGFERYNIEIEDGTKLNQDYKRLDAALIYQLPLKKAKYEIGISVLNLLDTDNIKYSNLRRATVDDINLVGIYAEAVPFTPTIFVKMEF